MTIRLPNGKHQRLRLLAEQYGISLNKLVEEWASIALAQFDAETRFRARAAHGDRGQGLALLAKLNAAFARKAKRRGKNSGKGKTGKAD